MSDHLRDPVGNVLLPELLQLQEVLHATCTSFDEVHPHVDMTLRSAGLQLGSELCRTTIS